MTRFTTSKDTLSYEEYYRDPTLPTPFNPAVYGDNFKERLSADLLADTEEQLDEQIPSSYWYKDAAERAVLEEVAFQVHHRVEHNEERYTRLQHLIGKGALQGDALLGGNSG